MATPARAYLDQAGLSGAFNKSKFNDQFFSIHQGDFEALRPRAQATPDMTVAVQASTVQSFYRQVYYNGAQSTFAGGNSPAFTAPTTNPRIDLLYLNGSGVLTVLQGAEAASPVPPAYPAIGPNLPLCEVYHRVGETKIVNFEDSGANPTQGYLYRDVRPWITIPGSSTLADVFRSGDLLLSANAAAPTGFTDESATYNNSFIRISSGTPLTTGGADTHSHGAGGYTGPSHTHGPGSYAGPSHTHGAGGYAVAPTTTNGGGCCAGGLSNPPATTPVSGTSAAGGTGAITGTSAADGSQAVAGTSAVANNIPVYVQVKIYKKT